MIEDKELNRLRALCEGATPGPWTNPWTEELDPANHLAGTTIRGADGQAVIEELWCDGPNVGILPGDAEFITASRTAMPALLEEIERLKQLLLTLNKNFQRQTDDVLALNQLLFEQRKQIEHDQEKLAEYAYEEESRCQ